jgi:hypothetical protein
MALTDKKAKADDAISRREALMRRNPLDPFAPEPDSRFRKFVMDLADDELPFVMDYWHMRCHHKRLRAVDDDNHIECVICGLVRTWQGDDLATMKAEWASYCPDGMDMFDWADLFVRDRSLWRYIHGEVLAEMVEGVIA